MPVQTYNPPDQSVDTFPTYKDNIDASIRVNGEVAANYAPHEAATPDLTVVIDAGKIWDDGSVTLIESAQQITAAFVAPATNPRIDRIAIDVATGNYVVIAGTEAASPVAPAYVSGQYPICQVSLIVSQTSIVNANLTSERPLVNLPAGESSVTAIEALASRAVRNWTGQTVAVTQNYRDIIWVKELKLFVVVGIFNGTLAASTSPDGVNWTARTTPVYGWGRVVWSPSLSLLVSFKYGSIASDKYMTSPDGITWTERTAPVTGNWQDLIWSPELGLFIVVGSHATNKCMTSSNGTTWTARTMPAQSWYGVAWSASLGLLTATAVDGTGNRVATSPDGIIWTGGTSAADELWYDVVWSPELKLFAAVSTATSVYLVMTSPDGITWTAVAGTTTGSWRRIAWSPEMRLFIAVGDSNGGQEILTSPDGIVWTTRKSAFTRFWTSICWSKEMGVFISISDNSSIIDPVMQINE